MRAKRVMGRRTERARWCERDRQDEPIRMLQAQQQGADDAAATLEDRFRGELESVRAELEQSREGYREAIAEKERLESRVHQLETKLHAACEQLVVQWGDHL